MPPEKFDLSAFIALFEAGASSSVNAGCHGVGFAVEMCWRRELGAASDVLIEKSLMRTFPKIDHHDER
jgi:hypothetical protein